MIAGLASRLALLALPAGEVLAAEQEWQFNAVPYVWTAGSTTSVRHPGFPIDVEADASFRDILENLDFGGMLAFEGRKGRWGFLLDGLFVKVSEDANVGLPPLGGARLPVDLSVRTFTGLAAISYRAVDDPVGSLDLIVGPRYWSLRSGISAAFPVGTPLPPGVPPGYDRQETVDWVDAMAGAKAVVRIAPGVTLNAHAMFGGGGSRFSSDSMGAVGFGLATQVSLLAGYRHLSAGVRRSNGLEFATRMHGPVLGLGVRF